jgi:hypothetical protein
MTALKRFRALYGRGPLHLLALLASFAIAGAAVIGWFQRPRDVVSVLEWFAAALVIHDLVLLPLYSLLDRIAFGRHRRQIDQAPRPTAVRLVNPTPYLRVPAILSGLLLAVFFPVIFGLGAQTELNASAIPEHGYLARWLLATGVLFAGSGVAYAAAMARAGTSPQPAGSDPDQITPGHSSPEPAAPDPDQTTPGDGSPQLAAPEPDHTTPGDDAAPPQGGIKPRATARRQTPPCVRGNPPQL